MIVTSRPGWYVDKLPTGEFAILNPPVVHTHLGDLPVNPNRLPLYTRITNLPEFQIAGQSNSDTDKGTAHYHDGEWHLDPRIAFGVFGCIFDLTGTLRFVDLGERVTSQGYRYAFDDGTPGGRLVYGDDTILRNGVHSFTDLTANQDGSFLIGQSMTAGVDVFVGGALRNIPVTYPDGVPVRESYDVHAYLEGDAVTFAFWDVQPDGLTAFTVDTTVAELLALPARGDAPTPTPIPAPKISNVQYDPLVKAGQPWRASFDCVETSFWVEFTEPPQRLRIHAVNDTGEDTTGVYRPIAIEGPDTPEPPEPQPMPILGRFWYQPNIGSKDLLQVFDQLPQAGAFVLYIQEILADQHAGDVGDNTYPNLVAAGAFSKLKAAGVPLAIEAGALKEFDCDGSKLREAMKTAVRRVEDAGGVVAAFSMDEPLTGNTIDNAQGISCDLPLSACVDVMAAYITLANSLGCLCNWLEAWPRIPLQALKDALRQLNARDALPHALHVDINYHECEQQHISASQIAAFIHAIQQECNQYGVLFGVFVNSTEDPIATDQAHHTNLVALANRLHGIVPDVAHVHVAAWASRVKNGPQDVPNNFGQFGLLSTFDEVSQIFEPIPVEPPEEIDLMDYKLVDYVLRVKAVKTSAAGGKVTAILPDDQVASVQPDGTFGVRPAGTDAAFEQAYDRAGLLLYEPVPDKRYAVAYRLDA